MMDKSWIDCDRRLDEYEHGVIKFLDLAFKDEEEGRSIRCPCRKCLNYLYQTRSTVYEHLIVNGFDRAYRHWCHHGESLSKPCKTKDDGSSKSDGVQEMLQDLGHGYNFNLETEESVGIDTACPNDKAAKFFKLLEESEKELYPGCQKFSKLSFIVQLMNIKCMFGMSGKAVDAILELLENLLPPNHNVPPKYTDAKKTLQDLGLKYEKIDACVNDCILYRGLYAESQVCPVCGVSRWVDKGGKANGKKVSAKIMRYFPLKERIQRLYMCPKTAVEMRWHKEKCPDDSSTRHPSTSLAWKSFCTNYPSFAKEPWNAHFGLAADGFSPYGDMSTSYSVWPVVLINYNLPPWMCMKDPYLMLSMIIPGPKAPGNDIDVYLQPLIDELKDLWEDGVETYDAASKSNIIVKAVLLWTVSDLPGLGVLSGKVTKGYHGCPCCGSDTSSTWLSNGCKMCYTGHRRFLPSNHSWRNNAKAFDGSKEHRLPPKVLSGKDVAEEYKKFNQVTFGKGKKRKRCEHKLPAGWKKKSIFFQLQYWETHLIHHNLDVMHIEKNVLDSLVGTIFDVKSKTKDNINSRFDLEAMGIRSELHAEQTGENKYTYRHACYTLTAEEKKDACDFLHSIKVPDGYSSNISRYIKNGEFNVAAMKCHDCHVFLHRYLPLVLRGVLKKEVCEPIIELSAFFRRLCAKKLDGDDVQELENSIVITLCKLEKVFPPSFFDIMMHLPVHLAREAKIAGPVTYRWMYFIERFLRRLKSFVGNKAHPEGSIAEVYIVQEAVTFCSLYLPEVETKLNRARRYDEVSNDAPLSKLKIFRCVGKPLRGRKFDELSMNEWVQARNYVLQNCEDVDEIRITHKEELELRNQKNVEQQHVKEFYEWFKRYVCKLKDGQSKLYTSELQSLAYGPDKRVNKYSSYFVNGWKFCTRNHDANLKTQNSGIVVRGDEGTGNTDYFGVLVDIVELSYGKHNVVLFKCDWWAVSTKGKGYKEDKYGFTLVNVASKSFADEPYILASQAEQVYYVPDTKDPNWQVVVRTQPRDFYDFPVEENGNEPCQENDDVGSISHDSTEVGIGVVSLSRNELKKIEVEGVTKPPKIEHDDDLLSEEEVDDVDLYFSDEDMPLGDDTDDDL